MFGFHADDVFRNVGKDNGFTLQLLRPIRQRAQFLAVLYRIDLLSFLFLGYVTLQILELRCLRRDLAGKLLQFLAKKCGVALAGQCSLLRFCS